MQKVFFAKDVKASISKLDIEIKKLLHTNSFLEVQDLLQLKDCFSDCDKSIFDLYIEHVIKSEAISPNSLLFFTKYFSIEHHTKRNFRKCDIQKLLKAITKNESLISLVTEAINLAGNDGKIILSTSSNGSVDTVELTKGSLIQDISCCFKIKSQNYSYPRIACIDGYIENVAEINKFLEEMSSKKEFVFLFARGFSEDVIHTLKINFDRNTLGIIPFIVKFDVESSNTLVDLSVISGCELISSLKGDLISSLCLSKTSSVNSIDMSEAGLMIFAKDRKAQIELHIFELLKKIELAENDATRDVVTKRLQRLGNKQVIIRLSESKDIKKKKSIIDKCLRSINMSSKHGIIEFKDEIYPAASYFCGKHYRKKYDSTVVDLGAVIKNYE